MSHTTQSRARSLAALLLVLGPAALLAGCGGGGGGSSSGGGGGGGNNNPTASGPGAIAGKIVDTTGSPVVSGVLKLDGVQQFGTPQSGGTSFVSGGLSFSQGGYQLDGVPTNAVHVVAVQTTVNGVAYTGSTQVSLPASQAGKLISNANVIVSPVNQQATISGYVRDQNGAGVDGAQVYFQSPFTTSPTSGTQANVSLVAVTFADGHYEIDNLPVQNGGAARAYAITASYINGAGQTTNASTTLLNQTFSAGEVLAASNGPSFQLAVTSSGSGPLTPTATLLQSFTQPDIPAFYAQGSVRANAAGGATVYDSIRAALSPAYAKMKASGRLAAQVKHLAAAKPHAATANTVEMDLFFALPGDQATAPDPQRSRLSGFRVLNDAFGTLTAYDFLQDPLANFYDDPDLGKIPTYNPGSPGVPSTIYQFAIQSIGLDGSSILGQSATLSVAPLNFIALTQPVDPNDTNGTIQPLSAPDTIQWAGIPAVQNYFVYLYASFPGVSTPALPQSADGTSGHQGTLAGTATSYTIPSGLTPGQEYWVVVAATASDNGPNASAISVSQIVPFIAQ